MGRQVNPTATAFMEKLNKERGWNLIGGSRSKEFRIRSMETATGRYYFDGFDRERMIFFEYDEPAHHNPQRKEKDRLKEEQLRRVLEYNNLSGTLVRYDEKTNTLTEKNMKPTATTVKIPPGLYEDFKVLSIRRRLTLQNFVERAVYLFVHDEEWRNNFNGKFTPSGSINLDIFDKNYTGSLS